MNIKIFGYKGLFNSTIRISSELVKRGFNIVDDDSGGRIDAVLHLNGLFADAEEFISKLGYTPKRIYNLLDVDESKDFSFYKDTAEHLKLANHVCAISNVVKDQMQKYFGLTNINVIGFPMQDIQNKKYHKTLDFLFVGRLNSSNKRFYLTRDTLRAVKFPLAERGLVTAGSEKPFWGHWIPNPDIEYLNEAYNSAKYVFHTSSFEGIGLSAVEAVCAGAFPLVCNDNPSVKENGLENFASEPNGQSIAKKIQEIEENPEKFKEKLTELREIYLKKYTLSAVCDNLERLIKC